MHFVVLTDTHLVAAGKRLYGLDPAERLAQAVAVINRDHAKSRIRDHHRRSRPFRRARRL